MLSLAAGFSGIEVKWKQYPSFTTFFCFASFHRQSKKAEKLHYPLAKGWMAWSLLTLYGLKGFWNYDCKGGLISKGSFQLKPQENVRFHLFINFFKRKWKVDLLAILK